MGFQDRKVTVMGLGHFGGGVGAARWLAGQGARVTVTDLADENALAESLAQLKGFPIAEFHLGGHGEEDFRTADFVVVNPAVRPDNRFLQIAHAAGAVVRTELELFLNACPAKVIGVTGSNGKSTTAAMIAAILREREFSKSGATPSLAADMEGEGVLHMPTASAGMPPAQECRQVGNLPHDKNEYRAWLGGNLGGSLLENLPEMRPEDWVVLEISSFQLWHFAPEVKMPRIAVVTGCTPNHLDWHGTFGEYAAAKQKLLLGQSPTETAVLNTFDAETAGWKHFVRGRLLPPYPSEKLASIKLAIPGEHNHLNAALAAAAAHAVGCTEEEIAAGLERFHGLPQRCEFVAVIDGRRYYNDSAATTPESTMAAIKTFDAPVWLLAGGRNKGFDFCLLAETIVRRARGAAFFGNCREQLHRAVAARDAMFPCSAFECLRQALQWCQENSQPGDTIVLSPGCASTDQFQNFQRRGEAFVKMVVGENVKTEMTKFE